MVEKYFSVSCCVMPQCKMLCAVHMWLFVNSLFSYEVFFLAFGIHNLSICSFCSILFNFFFKSHVLGIVANPNTNSMVNYSNNCQALALLKSIVDLLIHYFSPKSASFCISEWSCLDWFAARLTQNTAVMANFPCSTLWSVNWEA